MRRFYIQTYGCQMNDHESTTLKGLLADAGHVEVDDIDQADLIVVNTCTVRDKADQKAYSQIGRFKLMKDERPGIIVCVGGCMAQSEGKNVLSRAPYVDIVFGTQTLHKVPEMVRRVAERNVRLVWTEMPNDPKALEAFYSHAKAEGSKSFITVMQGCDNYCSYCIVPFVRGRENSRPSEDIFAEALRLSGQGVNEITLLGQNVNSYGLNGGDGVNFSGLIRKIAKIKDISRIRFTTSHPKDLSDELIELFGQEPKLMPHIHLPLQSGSDRVLELMNRKYTVEKYMALIHKLREVVPTIAITSDMIVGFPGETDDDFAQTLEVMDKIEYDNLFSFKYSPRRGTKAVDLPGKVPTSVMKQRLDILQTRQKGHTLKKNNSWIGKKCIILVDGVSKAGEGQLMGRTPENRIVNFSGPEALVGKEVEVTISGANINSLAGKLVTLVP